MSIIIGQTHQKIRNLKEAILVFCLVYFYALAFSLQAGRPTYHADHPIIFILIFGLFLTAIFLEIILEWQHRKQVLLWGGMFAASYGIIGIYVVPQVFGVETLKYVLLEPLIIVPPQLRIPPSLRIASQINTQLLRMIKDRLDVPLEPLQAQDPVLQDLNSMVTPSGFALKIRYSQLSYLVVEGVAGTRDPLLRAELQRLVTDATNPLVKANALIALAYSRDEGDLYLIQDALNNKSPIVRMGAMEAMDVGRFRSAIPSLLSIANEDPSHALQMFALYMLSKFGDSTGHALLISRLGDQDWPARAMAYWYLGRYGEPEDYSMILARLPLEENPFVQAEIALAVLRLALVDQR
jgi:hypothetical protein